VDGKFDIDVHFYSGSTATAYSLDVILNETDPSRVRARHYESKVDLPHGNSSQNGPTGSGSSRFNDILSISCNTQRICLVSAVDSSKLSDTTIVTQARLQRSLRSISTLTEQKIFKTTYDQCLNEYNSTLEKVGSIDWSCNLNTGAKVWH